MKYKTHTRSFIRFLLLSVTLSIVFFLLHSCGDDEPDPEFTATVSGTVSDAVSAEVLENVNVSLWNANTKIQSITTGNNGRFQLSTLVKGEETFAIKAELENYERYEMNEFRLNSGNQRHQGDISLRPKARIVGIVRNAKSNQPLENVTVLLSNQTQSISTNGLGEFQFLGLEQGEYRLNFSKDRFKSQEQALLIEAGKEVPMTVGLEPIEPVLEVDVLSRDFGTEETTLTLELRNSGGDTVKWSVEESIPWLTVNPSSGNIIDESTILSLTVNRNGFEPGTYSQLFTISSLAGKKDIQVSMTKAGAILKFTPSSLQFGTSDLEKTLELTRIGQGTLNYDIQTTVDWLKAEPVSGSISNEKDLIRVIADRPSLPVGNHNGVIVFNTDDGNQSVNVSLIIPDPNAPQLSIDQPSVNFGSDAINRSVTLTNTGEGIVKWYVTKTVDWLSVEETNGQLEESASQNIVVTVDRNALPPGNYTDVLRFGGNVSNINVPVEMVVASSPILRLDKTRLFFDSDIDILSFDISNVGNGQMQWNLSKNQEWIKLSSVSGINSETVNVSVDRQGLAYGNYSGQIDITSDGGEAVVTVEMAFFPPNEPPVAEFSISPSPAALNGVVEFDASLTTDDNDLIEDLEVRWKLDVSSGFTNWLKQTSISHTFESLGIHTVILEVRDTQGATNSTTKDVEVINNQAPTASFIVTPPSGERTNTVFYFDASSSYDDIDDVSDLVKRWQFEDQTGFSDGDRDNVVSHIYTTTGRKLITLEVRDNQGLTDVYQLEVEVFDNQDQDNDGVLDHLDADDDNDGLIEIFAIDDLDNIRKNLNASSTDLNGLPTTGAIGYELMNDLDFDDNEDYRDETLKPSMTTGSGWFPIASPDSEDFATIFEGNGHRINNLYIDRSTANTALFASTSSSAEIRNLHISIKSLSGKANTAGLIGTNRGYISGCSVTGEIFDEGGAAGLLVGRHIRGIISKCFTRGSITSTSYNAGGLIGIISGENQDRTTIENCYSTANVSAVQRVGGLLGYMWGGFTVIESSYATGDIESFGQFVGGLVGRFNGEIRSCYATGNVVGRGPNASYIGGFVGWLSGGSIDFSYSIGSVVGSSSLGGFAAWESGNVKSNNYWDIETSGRTSSDGAAIGLTTLDLQSQTTNGGIYVTWDSAVWDFGTNTQYPVLKNMPNGLETQR